MVEMMANLTAYKLVVQKELLMAAWMEELMDVMMVVSKDVQMVVHLVYYLVRKMVDVRVATSVAS